MNRNIEFIVKQRSNFVDGYNPGHDMVSKLIRGALASGVGSISVSSSKNALIVIGSGRWLEKDAFERMVPFPRMSINSIRPEAIVCALSLSLIAKIDGENYFFGEPDASISIDDLNVSSYTGDGIVFIPPKQWLLNN